MIFVHYPENDYFDYLKNLLSFRICKSGKTGKNK